MSTRTDRPADPPGRGVRRRGRGVSYLQVVRGRMILALEGPSNCGKSTLAEGLRAQLGEPVLILPCYADALPDGQSMPGPRARDATEQLERLEFFLEMDRHRREQATAAPEARVVIADRSWIGLLGHVYAVERTGGPAAFQAARGHLEASVGSLLQPDLVLRLVVDPGERRSRAEEAEENEWFTSDSFNDELEGFWSEIAPSLVNAGPVQPLDANQSASVVLACALEQIAAAGGRPK
jgi:thymidylate kinase